MLYFKKYVDEEIAKEVSKEVARKSLEGIWEDSFLDDIFDNEKSFRLFTGYCKVWTVTENGLTPMAGFYGVAE